MKRAIMILTTTALACGGLAGCAGMSETQRDTGTDAAFGAVAVVGVATTGGSKGESAATGAAVGAALGAAGGYFWSQDMQEQKAATEQATRSAGIAVSTTDDHWLRLEVPSEVSFDLARHGLKPNMAPVPDRIAASLRQHPVTSVRIVGHADSADNDAINDPLSVDRAAATRDYLTARGVGGERVTIDGRGSRQPIADNATATGRAINRRVEICVAEVAR